MHKLHGWAAALSAAAVLVAGEHSTALANGAHGPSAARMQVTEQATSFAFLDTAPGASALGDQLVGTGDLLNAQGEKIGSSSFHCVSTNAVPRTSELCQFVYTFAAGRITTVGDATLSNGSPIFDEAFAVTGGTGAYARVHGEVRVRQETTERATVTFNLRR